MFIPLLPVLLELNNPEGALDVGVPNPLGLDAAPKVDLVAADAFGFAKLLVDWFWVPKPVGLLVLPKPEAADGALNPVEDAVVALLPKPVDFALNDDGAAPLVPKEGAAPLVPDGVPNDGLGCVAPNPVGFAG